MRIIRSGFFVVLSFCGFVQFALADFERAMTLYKSQDYDKAFVEFGNLARAGEHASQFNLGVMYLQGQGVAQDPVQAYAWMALASQAGDLDWSRTRDKVYAMLSDTQKQQAGAARRNLAEKFSDGVLKKQDAIVILHSTGRGLVNTLVFAQFDTDFRFSIPLDFGSPQLHILHVNPGRYYVRNVGIAYANLLNRPIEQPDDINNTIIVLPGGVTYLGDWTVVEEESNIKTIPFSVTVNYSTDTVLAAAKLNPELRKLPLLMAKTGGIPVALSWD